MSDNFDDDADGGPRLSDLTRDGAVSEIIDRETAGLRRRVDAYREAAVDRELRLREREAAEADIVAEADRRSSSRHLRSI